MEEFVPLRDVPTGRLQVEYLRKIHRVHTGQSTFRIGVPDRIVEPGSILFVDGNETEMLAHRPHHVDRSLSEPKYGEFRDFARL